MEDDDSAPKFIRRLARPVPFVPETKEPVDIPSSSSIPNKDSGDEVADFYSKLVSQPSSSKAGATESISPTTNEEKDQPQQTVWCESCQMALLVSDYRRHLSGTAHQVSADLTQAPDYLVLNGSNVGFQMLRSQGWQYEEGLGPKGQGRRHPIATVLKQDRLGLGHQRTGRKAVTHSASEIEFRTQLRQLQMKARQPLSGKEIAKRARRETEQRKAMLDYMNR
ncbi:uncharacterized protein BYT42DRAFT_610675 [Radiomyces spectabilis]|uniref:uncharacterized protein n=1 Tax=Radiomyces spectabilis TaxID=64574 RepID=UPI0022205E7C|nr:uncharacterized protein BYT42DRAFT_610675 [Radiomyces spectabilis]KAI8391444.1 hypothetical protein BYT42DRAFT_610675 [Radiomyces spectabilis]